MTSLGACPILLAHLQEVLPLSQLVRSSCAKQLGPRKHQDLQLRSGEQPRSHMEQEYVCVCVHTYVRMCKCVGGWVGVLEVRMYVASCIHISLL